MATKFYFIKSGIVQVFATDGKTPIALMGEGSFFGEIGVLLTEKRSCSVYAKTLSIFLTVTKEDLLSLLESYPVTLRYLESVGKQRLKTTHPEDLANSEDRTIMSMRLQRELESLRRGQTRHDNMFGLDSPQNLKIKSNQDQEDMEAYNELYQVKVKWYLTE